MKLTLDLNNEILIETKYGPIPIYDFLRIAVRKDGRAIAKLETDACIDHPRLQNLFKPRRPREQQSRGMWVVIIVLLTMGYEVTVTKPKAKTP